MSDDAEDSAKRLLSGQWTYQDFLDLLRTMRGLGPLRHLPGMVPSLRVFMESGKGDRRLEVIQKILEAMTPDERKIIELLDPKRGLARRRAIAKRAGVPVKEVSWFVKTFSSMERVIEHVAKNGLRGFDGLADEQGGG